jgi:Ser/Thr protein kinase RdoA (MazF antagonist)
MTVMLEGPPGHMHPLALLEFVPGDPLSSDDPRRDEAVGRVIGTVQRVLNEAGYPALFGDDVGIYDYLEDREHTIAESDWILPMLSAVVAHARAAERDCPPTVGICYGDGIELLRDPLTGVVGVVDWGAVQRGPLLLDIAFQEARFAPGSSTWHVNQASPELLVAYLAEAPVEEHELALLPAYRAFAWARTLRYNAHRVAHGANWGARWQALSRQRLHELRANAPEGARPS